MMLQGCVLGKTEDDLLLRSFGLRALTAFTLGYGLEPELALGEPSHAVKVQLPAFSGPNMQFVML